MLQAFSAGANPTGPQVAAGQAAIQSSGKALTVINTPGTIINWQGFSIGAGELTRFQQQSALSAVLNRVVGADPSGILGTLSSNGRVFLINPHGMVFGAGSVIDTAGFVASTLNMADRDFLEGRLRFEGGGNGVLRNEGSIRASGDIFLVGPQIENAGLIRSESGSVLLAAGRSVTIASPDSQGVQFALQAPTDSALNIGTIEAKDAAAMFAATLRHSGEIHASRVTLSATGDTVIEGNALVSADSADGRGGRVEVLGERVAVLDNAAITARGATGGGEILIGGDFRGANPDVPNARATYVGPDTTIAADAAQQGDGGKVIVWAVDTTRAYGSISARGGPNGGNGGFVETSGHYLDVAGANVDAGAVNGNAGTWLLDPYDVTITTASAAGSFSGGTPDIWAPSATGSTVLNTDIQSRLNGGTSVTINTVNAGGAEAGNITVAANIAKTAGADASLVLRADGGIVVNSGIAISSASNKLNVTLNSNATGTGTGNIQMLAGSSIVSNGGNIVMGGGAGAAGYALGSGSNQASGSGIYIAGDITAGAGNVTLRGKGAAGFIPADGVALVGGTLSSDGTVTIDGVAQAWHANPGLAGGISDFVAGVHFMNAGTRLSTATGTVNITGSNSAAGTRAQGVTVDAATIETTGTGTLTLSGTSTPLPDTNWGIGVLFGGTVRTTAVGGGTVTLNGTATPADGGIVLLTGNVTSGGGEIRMISQSGGLGVDTSSLVGGASSGNILIKAAPGDVINLANSSTINAGANALTLSLGGGTANDNSNTITAGALRLLGSGTFNLNGTGNSVGTLASNVNGTVNYSNSGALAVGSVTSFDGAAVTSTDGIIANNNFTLAATGGIAVSALDVSAGNFSSNNNLIVSGTANWTGGTMSGTGSIINNGTFNWSGGTLSKPLVNNGAAAFGVTNTTYSGVYSGSGALTVSPSGGTFNFSPSLPGGYVFPSFTYNNLGTLNFDVPAQIANLDLQGSSFRGAGTITIPSGGTWTVNGTTLGGFSSITNSSGATANFVNAAIYRPLTNSGTMNVTGISTISTVPSTSGSNNGSLTNTASGVINLNGGWLQPQSSGSFTNAGQLNAVSGSNFINASGLFFAPTNVGTFTNNGTVTVSGGATLAITQGFASTGTGGFVVNPAGSLQFGKASGAPGAATYGYGLLTNDGAVTFASGTHTMSGVITNNGTLDITAGGLVSQGTFSSAGDVTLGAGTTLTNSGTYNWSGGALAGTGSFGGSGTFNLTGTGARVLNGPTLGPGGLTVPGGSLEVQSGALNLTGPSTINAGASLIATGGLINSSSAMTVAGTLRAGAGTVSATGITVTAGGLLTGNGAVTSNVINNGTVSPGNSPGTLTINGNYTQGANGALTVELGGTTQGVNYDFLQITGSATLGGTLNASLFGGFTGAAGNAFDVIAYASRTGDFTTFNSPAGLTMTATPGPAFYQLAFAVPPPATPSGGGALTDAVLKLPANDVRVLSDNFFAAVTPEPQPADEPKKGTVLECK